LNYEQFLEFFAKNCHICFKLEFFNPFFKLVFKPCCFWRKYPDHSATILMCWVSVGTLKIHASDKTLQPYRCVHEQ